MVLKFITEFHVQMSAVMTMTFDMDSLSEKTELFRTGNLITTTACSQFSSEEKIKSSQRIGYSVPRRVEEAGGTSGGA